MGFNIKIRHIYSGKHEISVLPEIGAHLCKLLGIFNSQHTLLHILYDKENLTPDQVAW